MVPDLPVCDYRIDLAGGYVRARPGPLVTRRQARAEPHALSGEGRSGSQVQRSM